MTGMQFAQRVLRLLSSGKYVRSEFKFEERDVLLLLDDVTAMLAKKDFYQNYNLGDKSISDEFLTIYEDWPVKFSDSRLEYYSDAPARAISLPNGMGIWEIRPMKDPYYSFIPLGTGSQPLYAPLESSQLCGDIGFLPEGGKIFYQGMNKSTKKYDKVLIKMVASNSFENPNDDVKIPADYINEAMKECIRLLGIAPLVADEVDDNNKVL